MWLQACLNGTTTRDEHPAVPLSPGEVAADAAACVAAGARELHIHPRDDDGRESLDAAVVGASVAAVRDAVPGVPVGVSTGLWITDGDPVARLAQVGAWGALPAGERPDHASCNLSETGWADVWDCLHRNGIGVESGIRSRADADRPLGVSRAGSVSRTSRTTRTAVRWPGMPPSSRTPSGSPARTKPDCACPGDDTRNSSDVRLVPECGKGVEPLSHSRTVTTPPSWAH